MTFEIDQKHPDYTAMVPHWERAAIVRSGEVEEYAEDNALQSEAANLAKKKRTVFTPWYSRLVAGVVGLIQRKPIAANYLSPAVEAAIAPHLKNINLVGDNLQAFLSPIFTAAIDDRWTWIYIAYPESDAKTAAESTARGDRPYWIHYNATDVFDWSYRLHFDGQYLRYSFDYLTQYEATYERQPDRTHALVERINQWELDESGAAIVWRWTKLKNEWQRDEEPRRPRANGAPLQSIPFVPVPTASKFLRSGPPPMAAIAKLNIRHYQISSDLANIGWLCGNPFPLFFTRSEGGGLGSQKLPSAIEREPDVGLILDKDARFEYGSLQPGQDQVIRNLLEDCEQNMAALAIAAITAPKNVAESAESKRLDRVQTDSMVAAIAQNLQDAVNIALEYHALYLGLEPPTTQLNRDYDTEPADPAMIAALDNLHRNGKLSIERLWKILSQLEVPGFDESFDPEAEKEAIAREYRELSDRRVGNLGEIY
jgi:hypothetical protein